MIQLFVLVVEGLKNHSINNALGDATDTSFALRTAALGSPLQLREVQRENPSQI